MNRLILFLAVVGLVATACGEVVEFGEATTLPTVAAVTTTTATLPVTPPTTTLSDVSAEMIELLDQLDTAWTPECDAAATEIARSRVEMVVEWAPTYEHALGSFGGTFDDSIDEVAALLEEECPEAGSVAFRQHPQHLSVVFS